MSGKICRVVAVQEIKLHPTYLNLPGSQPNRITGQGYLQTQPLAIGLAQRRDRQLPRVVIGIKRLLRPIFVNDLTKIALLIEQPNSYDRYPQVAGRFELIAG